MVKNVKDGEQDLDQLMAGLDAELAQVKQITGSSTAPDVKRLGTGAIEQTINEGYQQTAAEAKVRVYVGMDITSSMHHVVEAVRQTAERVGTELLGKEQGIEVAVIGISDHRHINRYSEPNREQINISDWGIGYNATSDKKTLVGNLRTLKVDQYSNGTGEEAYECFANKVGTEITNSKGKESSKKNVVVLFGDSEPHAPCPEGFGPEQIRFLAAAADHTYMVNCGYSFTPGTHGIVAGERNVTLVEFAQAEKVLAPAIVAMVMKAKGPEQLKQYLAALPAGESAQVTQVLQLTAGNGGSSLYKGGK